MRRTIVRGGSAALLLLAAAGPAAASSVRSDTTRILLEAGPSFDAHADRLASPFRQSGSGFGFGAGLRTGGFSLDMGVGSARTSSALDEPDAGVEDVWTGNLEAGWLRTVAGGDRTRLRVGASLAAFGHVRRHHYGPNAAREYYADLVVPISAVGEVRHRLGATVLVEERLSVGLAGLLFRSPYHAAKTFPDGGFVGPGTLRVVRHRLSLDRALSGRVRAAVVHTATFYDTDRHRPVTVLHQEVRVGLSVLLGGGGR